MIRIGSIPAAAAFVMPVCRQSWDSRIAGALAALATGARSESVRLQASTRMLDLVLRHRSGFDMLSREEATSIVREMVELALARLPEDEHEGYVREVRAIATRC